MLMLDIMRVKARNHQDLHFDDAVSCARMLRRVDLGKGEEIFALAADLRK
ncbi:hypothetical protein SLEP1_g14514 [Rubroshorea leprosula]|uniref:Uncharacterized protein n=1 Tax=Rubroshorea leprosula TaxID=152421 RepID=A0AAV5IJE5_9ROSI|nr:hypothetical protein SLEP1_g14514 [Rubroshorea leprosula]